MTTFQPIKILSAGMAACLSLGHAAAADQFEAVREKIRRELSEQRVASLTVAVARHGEILWEEGFGWADRERKIQATPHTAYSLASISKPITATGLMVLVERGRVDLDRPVNDYLGDVKLRGLAGDAGATVAAVASHTAGLPLHYQFFLEGEGYPRPAMDETLRRYGILVTQPGEKYQYSNLGYGILDYVIERKSGKSYPAFLREEVFAPLGMEHTAIPISGADLVLGREWAVRYWDLDTPLPFYDFDHRGGSAVYACAHDLVRFGMFHLGQKQAGRKAILKESSIRRMQQPIAHVGAQSRYGLGWALEESRMGVRTVSHTGGMGGVATSLVLAPEEGLAVVVLSNGSARLPHEISHDILAALLPEYERNLAKSRASQVRNAGSAGEAPGTARVEGLVDLQGLWEGRVETYGGRLPFRLRIDGTADGVEATLGDQAATKLQRVQLADGYLSAVMEGDIGTSDANRRAYSLQLSLKRRGETLNGAMTAVGKPAPKLPNALTSWVELRRVASKDEKAQ